MSVLISANATGAAGVAHEPLRFLEAGASDLPAVLLLHGLFGSPDNWQPIIDDLGDRYRFLALQLPIDDNGDRKPKSFHSLSQLTDYVLRFLDDLRLTRVAVVGNSLGGQIALDLYLRAPNRVSSLVLCGSAGLFERNLGGKAGPRLTRDLIRTQAHEIFHDPVHVTEELVDQVYDSLLDRKYRRFLLRVAKATRDRYMIDDLAHVEVPTQIIWGRDDTITPPFVAEQFRDHIHQSDLTFIDDCGHAPPIEQPKEFARLLDEFLSATATDGASAKPKPR